jgi:enoyl-CoA hydratase/carnithine racemase
MSVDVSRHDGVAVIVMNRPERKNAFDRAQYEGVAAALRDADSDDSIRCAVVTGAGGSFSSGQDLKEMAQLAAGTGGGSGFPILLDALESFGKPLLAAVEGVAVGIGMTMLPYFDIVFVAESARMRVPFTELGVPPEAASSVTFAAMMGWQRAADLLLTSRWIDAREAVELGLALRTVPDGTALDRTIEHAGAIAAKDPFATSVVRRLMMQGRGESLREARAREEALFKRLFEGRR